MVRVTIEVPDGALASLRQDSEGFIRAMRLAAAAKWLEMGIISEGEAAEIAALSPGELIEALSRLSFRGKINYSP